MQLLLFSSVLAGIAVGLISASETDKKPIYTYQTTGDTCDGLTLETACGPAHWGRLHEACTATKASSQSPIDINTDTAEFQKNMAVPVPSKNRVCTGWVQFANDHAFEVSFADDRVQCELSATYMDKEYKLLQLHFHSPSEHMKDGKYYDAEVHLVHKGVTDGDLLVMGAFMNVNDVNMAKNNAFLSRLWEEGETYEEKVVETSPKKAKMDPYKYFVGEVKKYYNYMGSLTTPDCQEGVNWFVRDKVAQISLYDLTDMRSIALNKPDTVISPMGNNNRPRQELNGRTVYTNV
jgi:carbonic anhydrase